MNKAAIAFRAGFEKEANSMEKYLPNDYDPKQGEEYVVEPNQPGNIAQGALAGGVIGGGIGSISSLPFELGQHYFDKSKMTRFLKPLAAAGGLAGAGMGGYIASEGKTKSDVARHKLFHNVEQAASSGKLSNDEAAKIWQQALNDSKLNKR